MSEQINTNTAPYPTLLAELIAEVAYRPGWSFALGAIDRGQGSDGLTMVVTTLGHDTYHPERGETYAVSHYFPVPPANYNRESWQRWLFDRLVEVETHEACEFFRLVFSGEFVKSDGTTVNEWVTRPFAPNHGPGWDPYGVRELNSKKAAETTFRGEHREGTQERPAGMIGTTTEAMELRAILSALHEALAFMCSCERSGERGADHPTVLQALELARHA